MGASIATSVAKNATKSGISIANNFSQSCKTSLKQNQVVDLSKCKGATIGTIKLNENAVVNTKCLQSSSTQSQMKSSILSRLTQETNAVTQSLGLPSVGVASSIANATANLSESITNAYTQDCISSLPQNQSFTCSNSANIKVGSIILGENATSLTQCTAKNQAVINAQAALSSALGQTTAAKEANSFSTVIVFFLIFLGIFAYGFMQFSKSETAKWIIILIFTLVVLLIIAYSFNAYEKRLWPFQKSQ